MNVNIHTENIVMGHFFFSSLFGHDNSSTVDYSELQLCEAVIALWRAFHLTSTVTTDVVYLSNTASCS